MVGDFIICLLAFFNIFIYLFIYLFFIYKKRGPERGPEGGPKRDPKRGVQKGGSTFCLHPRRLTFYQNSKYQEYYGENLSKHVQLVYSKDLKTVANEFNSYFSSVGSRTAEAVAKLALENNIICSNSSMPDLVSSFDDCFRFTPVSTVDVRRTILSLPLNRAPGPDI